MQIDPHTLERAQERGTTLEKAIYELGYELNNHPDWVKIPLQVIRQLVGTG